MAGEAVCLRRLDGRDNCGPISDRFSRAGSEPTMERGRASAEGETRIMLCGEWSSKIVWVEVWSRSLRVEANIWWFRLLKIVCD